MASRTVSDPSSLHDALVRAQRLLAARERSVSELRGRLKTAGFDSDVVEEAVDRLVSSGLLSDARFADCFIRTKLSAGWGRVRIERELEHRGVDCASVPGWPEEYVEMDEYERALDVLDHAHIHSKNIHASAYRRLVSKGFSQDVAYRASREYADSCKDSI